jgi:sortase A
VTDSAVGQPPASDELAGPNPAEWSVPGRQRVRRVRRPPRQRRAPLRRKPLSAARTAVIMVFGGVAALALWFVLYALLFSGLQEGHAQHVLYTQLRYGLAEETIPFGGAITPGTPVAYLSAPSIGVSAVVVEGTSSADLSRGPGHLPDSPMPGQQGISQIDGRSVTFGAPFGRVHELRPGAKIWVITGQGTFGFRVIDVRGPGDPKPTGAQRGKASLTLATSGSTGAWRNGWAPDEVIYADATLVSGQPQQAPAGRPTAVPAIDKLMAGDNNEVLPAFLWLEGLLAASWLLGWAYTRWNSWQLWLVAAPVLLALLWGTTSAAMLLLPNLT